MLSNHFFTFLLKSGSISLSHFLIKLNYDFGNKGGGIWKETIKAILPKTNIGMNKRVKLYYPKRI